MLVSTTREFDEGKRAELQAAFREFGSISEHLADSFDALRTQVDRLQSELREARTCKEHLDARLSALVDSLPGGVLVLDAAGVICEMNPAAVELLGEPLLRHSIAAVFARAAVPTAASPEHMELRSGRFVNVSRRDLGPEGEVVLLTDVTESHLLQTFLSRQQRLLTLGELAAGLAHQIRTPLATALLYASQMMLPDRSREDLTRCSGKTVTSLKLLDQLVTDMLAFARDGATRESVSLSALLEQVAQWLRPGLRPGITLTIRTQAPHLMVRANAPSLVSALLNLATNALQAAPAEANLALELLACRGDDGCARIMVSDDGPGIPAHIRDRIFEPFFTTRARGNGIGLSIVKSVVEAHHGCIRLADSPRGAAFVIDLPAEEAP